MNDKQETPAPVSLPTDTDALWALAADVLQALQDAGEDPRLEADPLGTPPGIRRTAEDGRWHRMVEWTNSSGAWRWTAPQGSGWQWPGAERLAKFEALAVDARQQVDAFNESVSDLLDSSGEVKSNRQYDWACLKDGAEEQAWDVVEALASLASGQE